MLNTDHALSLGYKPQSYQNTDDGSFTGKGVYSVAYLNYTDMQWLHHYVYSSTVTQLLLSH